MVIYWTRTKTVVSITLIALTLAGLLVKRIWFPHIDASFFTTDYEKLERAPSGVLILRPTQFAGTRRAGAMTAPMPDKSGRYDAARIRMVGRDVGFEEVIAAAYQCDTPHVLLTPDAPTNHYDFLVTVSDHPAEKLQAVIRKKFGYVAGWQQATTEVLQIKVDNPVHPALRSSSSHRTSKYKTGKIYFQGTPIEQLIEMAEEALGKPVQDQTELKGNYDFAVSWDWRGRRYGPDAEAMKQSLAELGLGLHSEMVSMTMMVVQKSPK